MHVGMQLMHLKQAIVYKFWLGTTNKPSKVEQLENSHLQLQKGIQENCQNPTNIIHTYFALLQRFITDR